MLAATGLGFNSANNAAKHSVKFLNSFIEVSRISYGILLVGVGCWFGNIALLERYQSQVDKVLCYCDLRTSFKVKVPNLCLGVDTTVFFILD